MSGHDHDIYTKLNSFTNAVTNSTTDALSIYDMTNTANKYVLKVEKADGDIGVNEIFEQISAYLPKLGTIRFVSAKNLDTYASEFDYNNS